MKTMENKSETMTDRTAAPSSQSSSAAQTSPAAPKRYVVNHGFDKLFFLLSIPFIAVSLLVVSVFVFFALIPERPGSVPDFVKYVAGDQYEVVVRRTSTKARQRPQRSGKLYGCQGKGRSCGMGFSVSLFPLLIPLLSRLAVTK